MFNDCHLHLTVLSGRNCCSCQYSGDWTAINDRSIRQGRAMDVLKNKELRKWRFLWTRQTYGCQLLKSRYSFQHRDRIRDTVFDFGI